MVKKLVSMGIGAAMFFAVATPAFAADIWNWADIWNDISTVANTGGNEINSFWGASNNSIKTGAAGASSTVNNVVNTNTVNDCLCEGGALVTNAAGILNDVNTLANTGENTINSGSEVWEDLSLNSIVTGQALSQAAVTNVVNTNIVGF